MLIRNFSKRMVSEMKLHGTYVAACLLVLMTDIYAQTLPSCAMRKEGANWFVNSFKAQHEGGEMTYASDNQSIAVDRISGQITKMTAGETVITVTQAANKKYKQASKKCTLTVVKGTPNISGLANIVETYGKNKSIKLNPTSLSKGRFSYRSSNLNVATVSDDGWITILDGTGDDHITITVTQATDNAYVEVSKKFLLTINPADAQISTVYCQTNCAVPLAD